MLDTIHAHATRQHQNHDDEHRGNDLVPFFIEYGGNDVERVVFRIEPEQMENPRHAQHTENDKPGQEKSRNDRAQIHNTVKRNEETDRGSGLAHSRIVIKISKARLRRLLLSPI